jgi:hypothetical protein
MFHPVGLKQCLKIKIVYKNRNNNLSIIKSNTMRKSFFIVSMIVATTLYIAACNENKTAASKNSASDTTAMIERGEYLVSIGGCDDCHSPKRMGERGPELIPELRLSGFRQTGQLPPVDTTEVMKGWALFAPDQTAAVGPWGASYAGNITSDETGIGNWTEAQFINCLRKGKFKGLDGSRPLLPPMPWVGYSKITDEDLKSIYYYLKTTSPVENIVPAPKSLTELVSANKATK